MNNLIKGLIVAIGAIIGSAACADDLNVALIYGLSLIHI